jgi:hypothetical protein
VNGKARRSGLLHRFVPDRWYTAEWVGDEGGDIRLVDGRASAVWSRHEIEVRPAEDDEWLIGAVTRFSEDREGQSIEYPTRLAECPQGHRRPIPTRFDRAVVDLVCRACERTYKLTSG